MKYRFIPPFIITLVLFFVPFFWFKPGEMDLGGDSSRLYFYDPLRYLTSQALYAISHSGLGGEGVNYFGIPFFLLLAGLKSILNSPTILIAFIHGLLLSGAFLFCYLIVKQLLFQDEEKRMVGVSPMITEICALIAGLYYVSAPVSILIWNHMLLTDNQIFLNPLIFFLLLRYLLTQNMRYMFVVLGITFLFAPNFSIVGSPAFFAFYPLAFLFLMFYTIYVIRKPLPLKGIAIGVVLFFLLHAFHLAPVIESLLTPGSPTNTGVFSQAARIDSGLGYFNALVPGIKLSISLLGLQQMAVPNPFFFVFIVFPAIFILGFLWNKRKSMLLTGIFFLITLFFVTANITTIGLNFYRLLFHIPGFSMFRIFFGQWMWVYLFFYTLLLGQALLVVIARIKKWQGISLMLFLIGFLIIIAWPFISGKTLQYIHWQTKNVSAIVVMDPEYEKVLSYLRSLPVDGKILSLPLSDPGYQAIKGGNDAAYEGPSTITYLAGRNEFMGFVELESFGPSFLQAAREKNYVTIRDMLSMLNVRYIYYNEDPYIYGNNFPGQPYIHVSNFLPGTQQEYKEFIKGLGVKEIKTIGDKYHIYEFDDSSYLPHIYAAGKTAYWNDYLVNLHIPLSFYKNDKRIAFYDDIKILERQPKIFDDLFFKAKNMSDIFDFFKVKKLPRFVSPTVKQKFSSLLYPLIALREKIDLARFKTASDPYIDRSVYFIEKRINELARWAEEIPLLGNIKSIADLSKSWQDPKLWEFNKYGEYNSWEATLVRYQQAVEKLIDELEKTTRSSYSIITNKVELKSDLIKHKNKLRKAIREDSIKSIDEKKYLLNLIDGMFADIFVKLNFPLPDYWNMPYGADISSLAGVYEVYLNKEDAKDFNTIDLELAVDGKKLSSKGLEGEWIRFDDVYLKGKTSLPISLTVRNFPNLIEQTMWETPERIDLSVIMQPRLKAVPSNESGEDLVTLAINNSFLGNTSGLVRDVKDWTGDSIYTISFDYLTYNQNFSIDLYESGGTRNNQYAESTYNEILRSKEWIKFNAVVLSRKDAQSAFLHVVKDQEDIPDQSNVKNVKKIEIKNIYVVRVPDSQIILKKVVKSKEALIPQIIFTKINPTKYKVTVHGAKDPYALVLSQRFNAKWKIFLPNGINEAKTFKGLISRFFGKIVTAILQAKNIVISSEASGENLTSYFNNNVIEGMHKNIFLDQNTFETFGQDPIAEKTHLPVNGYANSWYISPEDVQNKENYELIIEMTSQKLFYVSLLISIGGFLLLFFLLLKSFIRK
ncbi:MAG: hypothetical protein A3H17_03345 [Candidatus Levybacteria bacterium RIFCSPLOWO2_12_FULL_37_14]|nr:MAG: hypothetical protein A3H17_03345 [Candidatus Levybacteria bacterium RIFCSPLOWO2_12_FULL_37_14]